MEIENKRRKKMKKQQSRCALKSKRKKSLLLLSLFSLLVQTKRSRRRVPRVYQAKSLQRGAFSISSSISTCFQIGVVAPGFARGDAGEKRERSLRSFSFSFFPMPLLPLLSSRRGRRSPALRAALCLLILALVSSLVAAG